MEPCYSGPKERCIIVVATALLLSALLLALLPAPGLGISRVVYFAAVAAVGWAGAAGVVLARPRIPLAAGVMLFLLGFWQFTIGLFVVPAAFAFVVFGLLLRRGRGGDEERPN